MKLSIVINPLETYRKPILFILCLLLFPAASCFSQVLLTGKIIDASSEEPIPFASVAIVNHNEGDLTDTNGLFKIKTTYSKGTIRISATGYEPKSVSYDGSDNFTIALSVSKSQLNEITIRTKRVPYHNKNNPAVELIRQVIDHKDENRLSSYQQVQYQDYTKMVLSFVNPSDFIQHKLISKKYQFLFDNIDTTTFPGKRLLPLFIEEKIYKNYEQQNPAKKQSLLVADKKILLDKRYVNNQSLGRVMHYIYQDIDLYQNSIFVLTNNFLSPIAPMAPQFYRYFITDTIINNTGQKIVELSFQPRNSHDLLFYGTLYVALNGHFSITEAKLLLPRFANIDWIKNFHTTLKYLPDQAGKYYIHESKTGIEFGINGLNSIQQAIYGERTRIVSGFNITSAIPDSIFTIKHPLTEPDSVNKPDSFWVKHRPVTLSKTENGVYKNIDSLDHMKSFKRLVSWGSFLFGGYKNIGPVELGSWKTFYSFNPVEGFKPRVGGRTTDAFSNRIYLQGNVAYGFHDQQLKHYASAAFSFNKKNVFWGYPQHYFQITSIYDTRLPGRGLDIADEGNIFLSIQRGENDRYLYNKSLRADYVNELIPHLTIDLGFENLEQVAAGSLYFIRDLPVTNETDTFHSITTSAFSLSLRWAPHETFLPSRGGRTYLPSKYPVIEAEIETGFKGLYGGEYDYQKYQASIQKRFYLSKFGYADVTLDGGYLAGKVPYPLLFIPPANQTYNIQESSYNLMNYLEFISDKYAEVAVNYHMKGLLLNNIPFIKWLRAREVFGFKAIYGTLNSANSAVLLSLPKDDQGRQATYTFKPNEPYMEVNVGIENILNLIRIDYVRRLNYLNHPGVSANGIRFAAYFSF